MKSDYTGNIEMNSFSAPILNQQTINAQQQQSQNQFLNNIRTLGVLNILNTNMANTAMAQQINKNINQKINAQISNA